MVLNCKNISPLVITSFFLIVNIKPAVSEDFSPIDKHALKAPASVTNTIEGLATYLIKPAKNDKQKARAVFRWMVANITYDGKGLYEMVGGKSRTYDQSAETVLKTRITQCGGFANLFSALAKAAGLEARVITGWFKSTKMFLGDKSAGRLFGEKPDHAWNVVRIDGTWRIIDASWGANAHKTHKRPDSHDLYFFIPPERWIYMFFPEDQQWQLLDKPITRDQFNNTVFIYPDYFLYGIDLADPLEYEIHTAGQIAITIKSFKGLEIMGLVLPEKKALINKNGSLDITDDMVTAMLDFKTSGETRTGTASINNKGGYLLIIVARRINTETEYRPVFMYRVVRE